MMVKFVNDQKAESTAALSDHKHEMQDLHSTAMTSVQEHNLADFVSPKRGPAEVPLASSTARSTASLRVLSSAALTSDSSLKRETPVDDLCPGARRLYDVTVGNSASATPSAPPPAPSRGVRASDFHEPAPATSTATRALEILRVMSTANPAAPSVLGRTSTGAATEVLLDSTPENASAATATHEMDLRLVTPTTCSTICPGGDTSATPILTLPNSSVSKSSDQTSLSMMAGLHVPTHYPSTASSSSPTCDVCIVPQGAMVLDVAAVAVQNDTAGDDTSQQDDQGMLTAEVVQCNGVASTLKQVRVQPLWTDSMFETLLRGSWLLVSLKVCPSSTEMMQHSLVTEKINLSFPEEMHLLPFVVMRKEAVSWPMFQSTGRDTVPLLPWDPGALMYGVCTNVQVDLEPQWRVSLVEQLANATFAAMPYPTNHGPPASDEFDGVASLNLVVLGAVIKSRAFHVGKVTLALSVVGLHDSGLGAEFAFQLRDNVSSVHLSRLIMQFVIWYVQYRWHHMSLSDHCIFPSFGGAFIQFGIIALVCLSLMHCAESNLRPPPHQINGRSLGDLKPWPSWQMPLQIISLVTAAFETWQEFTWSYSASTPLNPSFSRIGMVVMAVCFGMCMVLAMGNLPSFPCLHVLVILLCTAIVLGCLSKKDSVEKPKPPWSHLASNSPTSASWSKVRAVSETLVAIGITFQLNLHKSAAWYIFSAMDSSYSTFRNAQQLLSTDTCKQKWQNNARMQNPSCWNRWSFFMLTICWIPVLFLQWFWGLICAVQGYTSSSACSPLTFMNGIELKPWPSWELLLQLSHMVKAAPDTCYIMLTFWHHLSRPLSLPPWWSSCFAWEIAWLYFELRQVWPTIRALNLEYFGSGNKSGQPLHQTTVRLEDYLEARRAALASFFARKMQAGLNGQRKFSWDPGGLSWHRLGVKPSLKEGGIVSDPFPHGPVPEDGLASTGLQPTQ